MNSISLSTRRWALGFAMSALCGLTAFAQTLYVPSGTSGIGNSTTSSVGIGTSAPIRPLTINNGEMSLIPYTSTNYAVFNISDVTGNNGSSQMLVFRGLDSNGGAGVNLGHFRVDANIATFNGNVGIGSGSPASKLTVQADSAGSRGGEISIVNLAAMTVGSEAALNFGLEGSSYDGDNGNAQIKAKLVATNGASDLVFSNWSGSAFNEYLRLSSGGNVGIGTNSPTAKLDVAGGNVIAEQTIYVRHIDGKNYNNNDTTGDLFLQYSNSTYNTNINHGRFIVNGSGSDAVHVQADGGDGSTSILVDNTGAGSDYRAGQASLVFGKSMGCK